MAATYPLTLTAWNAVLGEINYLAGHPPEGCDPIAPLSLVSAPHKWSVQDIAAAQNKLTEICSDNTFTAAPPGDKWRKRYIDELWDAIDNGWCNCEPEIPCCIPTGNGTVWIEAYGGYWVTMPYWQIVEQYLYGNISYSAAEAAFPDGVFARIVECYPGSGGFISHSFHHDHWVNCVYQDTWLEGGKRGEEYWSTCTNTDTEVTYLGRLPSISSSYGSSTSVGGTNYGSYPWTCQYHYDYIEGRWYQTCQIGYFEVDAYWYYFAYWNLFTCS